jgi:PAS domain S-box-containing protein
VPKGAWGRSPNQQVVTECDLKVPEFLKVSVNGPRETRVATSTLTAAVSVLLLGLAGWIIGWLPPGGDQNAFMPHGYCYLWNPLVLWLNVISDSLIVISYYCIPVALIYLARKRRDMPFNLMFWLFGLFIAGCGTTHLMEVWNIWHANYLLAGGIKAVTAAVSMITAVMIVPLIPKAITLPHLVATNLSLEKEVQARADAERELRQSKDQLSGIIGSAMDAIITADGEQRIVLFNAAAERMFRCRACEVMGQPIDELIPQRFRAQHGQHIHDFQATGNSSRAMGTLGAIWGVRADGEEFPIEASISQVQSGNKHLFTVILRDISERQREEAHRLRLAAIVDSSEQAILSKDLSGHIVTWNKGAEKLYGYTAEEAVGRPASMLFPPSLHEEEKRILSEVAAGRQFHLEETTRLHQSGRTIQIAVSVSPVKDAHGVIVGAASISHDIRDRLQMETALRESRQRMASILESAMDAIIAIDENMQVLLFNAAAEKMFRCPAAEVIGQSVERLIPARFRPQHTGHVRKFGEPGATNRAMGTLGAIWGVRADGEEFPIEASISQVDSGDKRLFTVILRDISERQRAEELFRRAVESAPCGILMAGDQGKIVLVNTEAEKLFGYKREELLGQPIETLMPARFRAQHHDQAAGYQKSPSKRAMGDRHGLLGQRKDGSEFPLEIGLNPVETAAGKQVLVTVVDVTARRRAEEEKEEYTRELQRSNAELEQFAYVASHDLQEPLRMVASYTEILGERYRGKLDANADKYIGYAVDGAQRMQRVIRDLLAYARVSSQAKPLQPTDSAAVLASVIRVMHSAIDSSKTEIICGQLPTIMADELQLSQVFQNLITNAIKFHADRAPRIEISAALTGATWEFSVKDNGIGMDMEHSGRIFQMFQRLHSREEYEGTGIGLAIAKRIVERHGGRIWCDSVLGEGTTFHFTMLKAALAAAGGAL